MCACPQVIRGVQAQLAPQYGPKAAAFQFAQVRGRRSPRPAAPSARDSRHLRWGSTYRQPRALPHPLAACAPPALPPAPLPRAPRHRPHARPPAPLPLRPRRAQVGRDARAQAFLSKLDQDPVVGGVIDCTSYYELEAEEVGGGPSERGWWCWASFASLYICNCRSSCASARLFDQTCIPAAGRRLLPWPRLACSVRRHLPLPRLCLEAAPAPPPPPPPAPAPRCRLRPPQFARKGVNLSVEAWLLKLMVGAIDPSYDAEDEGPR
jgi:hypothetical protein